MTTPTKEQVMEAANTSPEAKAALAKLFPDYFKPEECQVSRSNVDDCFQNNDHYFAASNIAKNVANQFMNVMDYAYGNGIKSRQSFLLSSTRSNARWKIVEFGDMQVLTPVTLKTK